MSSKFIVIQDNIFAVDSILSITEQQDPENTLLVERHLPCGDDFVIQYESNELLLAELRAIPFRIRQTYHE